MDIEIDQIELKYAGLRIGSVTRLSRLVGSILRDGQQTPVLVVGGESDRFVLIDGYARVAALRALLRDTVLAVRLEVDEVQALVLNHRLANSPRRAALEDGWLIHELTERHGLSLGEVANQLQRSKSWVSRRLGLVRVLPDSVQQAVRNGMLPAYAAGKYLVPLARANEAQCRSLIKNMSGSGPISVRDVQQLYLGWRRGNATQRLRITEKPLLYLQAEEVSSLPLAISATDPVQPFLKDLGIISGVSRRAQRRLKERDFDLQAEATGLITQRAFDESRIAFVNLSELLEETMHAGSGNKTRHFTPES